MMIEIFQFRIVAYKYIVHVVHYRLRLDQEVYPVVKAK